MIRVSNFRSMLLVSTLMLGAFTLPSLLSDAVAQDSEFSDSLFDDSVDPLFQEGDGSLSLPDSVDAGPILSDQSGTFTSNDSFSSNQSFADTPGPGDYSSYGNGVKTFPVETCDPLLVAVLTGSGYMRSSLDELYGGSARCGFVKAQTPQPVPTPPVQNDPGTLNPPPDISLPDPTLDTDEDDGGLLGGLIPGRGFLNSLANNLYVSARLGYVLPSDATVTVGANTSSDNPEGGFGGSVALGYKFNMNNDVFLKAIRAELEGNYTQYGQGNYTIGGTSITGGDTTLFGGFLNAYADVGFKGIADIDALDSLGGYIGGGIGYVQTDTTYTGLGTASGGAIAFQGMLGLSYDLSEQMSLGLGYKFMSIGETEENGIKIDSRAHHIVEGKLIYLF
jgi:opacity protein-like surface antigen